MMQLEVAGLGALLASEHVTGVTRAALEARLMEAEHPPRFLAAAEFATLAGVCKRLLPQDNVGRRPIASLIDTRLADGRTDGWRYAELPNDGEAFRAGLAAIDVAAGGNFVTLNSEMQDAVLSTIQQSHPLFFKDLLAEVVERLRILYGE